MLRDDAHRAWSTWCSTPARWLDHNEAEVAALVENRAPSWTPQWVDKRVASRVHEQVVEWVAEISRTPQHKARIALDGWLTQLRPRPAARRGHDAAVRAAQGADAGPAASHQDVVAASGTRCAVRWSVRWPMRTACCDGVPWRRSMPSVTGSSRTRAEPPT
ncbi:DUF445 family protein [Aeromicrobium sp. UC242_57]|uniref:DUF445 family protein n=1 Tax=Aeromicrobium sp. UC242_57 TaxID=3374624 RepID=UPI00379018A3